MIAILCLCRWSMDFRGLQAALFPVRNISLAEDIGNVWFRFVHRTTQDCQCCWHVVPHFRHTRVIALLLLSIFPSTDICESSFSSRNTISSAHLGQCLHIATAGHDPNFWSIVSSKHCQLIFSTPALIWLVEFDPWGQLIRDPGSID